ncbi:hypothetical protein K7G98_08615 [Saccharothrix sp. MB29]|nr:hypothetical protein [Saccharothrix sp. MB29]
MLSTPAAAPTRAPCSAPACAATFARARAPAHQRRHLVRAERRRVAVRAVEVELDQVRAVVELHPRRAEQVRAVRHLDRQTVRQRPGARDPRAGGPQVRPVRAARPRVAQPQAQRPLTARGGVRPAGRADVARPPDARAHHQLAVLLGDREQLLARVETALHPLRATGHAEVGVGVDHAGHERRPGRVDHPRARRCRRPVALPQPGDHAALHQQRHPAPQRVRAPVGQRRALQQHHVAVDPGHVPPPRRPPAP